MKQMMTEQSDPSTRRWAAEFRQRAAQRRIPVTAMLELTSRCNLRCQHCYLDEQVLAGGEAQSEMDTEQVKQSLREWVDAGCLYLILTGGDPMMRRDFAEIYRAACELGLLVTVFCNGTLISESILDVLKAYPPRRVEVSIYGATAKTYEAVTRVPGSFKKAWHGIQRLHEAGFNLTLKTMLLSLNGQELEAMQQQADRLGCRFRFDSAVFPRLTDGSDEPTDLRVSPQDAVRYDLSLDDRRKKWAENIERKQNHPEDRRLYLCGAGRTFFYADPCGSLSPCLMTTQYANLTKGRSFLEVWEKDFRMFCGKQRTRSDGMLYGAMRGACSHCPAVNYLETGDEEVDSEYMRETARLRYNAVVNC